jgi:hypothetical protein
MGVRPALCSEWTYRPTLLAKGRRARVSRKEGRDTFITGEGVEKGRVNAWVGTAVDALQVETVEVGIYIDAIEVEIEVKEGGAVAGGWILRAKPVRPLEPFFEQNQFLKIIILQSLYFFIRFSEK